MIFREVFVEDNVSCVALTTVLHIRDPLSLILSSEKLYVRRCFQIFLAICPLTHFFLSQSDTF